MTFSLVLLLAVLGQFGQPDSGELRVIVADETGLALPSTVLLASDVAQVRRQLDTDGWALRRPGGCRSDGIASPSPATGLPRSTGSSTSGRRCRSSIASRW